MSKPLELTVFQKEPGRYGREPRYHSPDGLWAYPESHVDGYAADKRLTDAELAAEVFRQAAWIGANHRAHKTDEGRNIVFDAAFTFGPITHDEHEFLTISRFATLPHYDEAQS